MFKKNDKRGLSPVIATVLLVGLVVVSGLIIFMWFRGLTQEAVTKFDQNIQLVCDDVQFDARYSTAGDLSIKNIGTVPIFGFKVITSSSGGHDTKDLSDLEAKWDDEGDGLIEGEATSVNIVSGLSGDITLVPVLVGTSQKGAQASFACDEKLYGREISV